MRWWNRIFNRQRLDGELSEEIRVHFAMAVRDRIERGQSREAAEQDVRREFGNQLLVQETTRDQWGWTRMEQWFRNLRYVLRQMRRTPGFTAVAILSLAIGLGATTVMFSVVNGVLLQPLNFYQPESLYLAQNVPPPRANLRGNWPINGRHFHEWRAHCESCEQVALIDGIGFTLTGMGEPERLPAADVSYNFFRTIGVAPVAGRDFSQGEEAPGNFHVVVLSNALWRTHFASDPNVLGRKIMLNGEPHEIVGVLPASLAFPKGREWGPGMANPFEPLLFRPLRFDASRLSPSGSNNYVGVIRPKPGRRPEQIVQEMNAIIADFVRQYKIETKPTLVPMQEQVTGATRGALWLLLGIVGAVLLIVCVNIGNLMLVRTAGRYREAGIRLALGASRGQLFGLVFQEALVLVIIGGVLGLLLASSGLSIFKAVAPADLPRLNEVRLDWRVLSFALAAMGLSTILCGVLPAWRLARTESNESIKAGASTVTEGRHKLRFREALVSVEVALSTILLLAGGLLLFSFMRVLAVDKGVDVSHVITQDIALVNAKYTAEGRNLFLRESLRRLSEIPGVRYAGLTSQLPLRGSAWTDALRDGAIPRSEEKAVALVQIRFVSAQFLPAIGVRLQQGRLFEEADMTRDVTVISERSAQILWPGQNPIGRKVWGSGVRSLPMEVIGTVAEVRTGMETEAPLTMYLPFPQWTLAGLSFALRTDADPREVMQAMRGVLRSMDSELPLTPTQTMEQIVDASLAVRRFETWLAGSFAIAALLLAALGVFGVISFTVAKRTPELGVRIALGARPAQLRAMVLRQGMSPVVIGLLAGLAGFVPLRNLIASQLFGVTPQDPAAIAAVILLLLLVAAAACWVPARRAARIDPLRALRCD